MDGARNIVDLLRRTAERFPDHCALATSDETLTYRELWQRVTPLASHFASRPPGGKVLIVSTNSFDYVVTYFATLLARQIAVEVSPHESKKTYRAIVSETSPWTMLTDIPGLASELGLASVNTKAAGGSALDVTTQIAASNPNDLASIVYTSGTTGTPKGVMLSHGNFLSVTEAILDYLEIGCEDRYLLGLPLFHTYGKSVLLTTTQVGGSIWLFDDFPNLPRFLDVLQDWQITVFSGVPFHINMLLRRGDFAQVDLSRLSRATVSGAPLDPLHISEFTARLPHVKFFFMYGLTESCTRAFYLPPERAEQKPGSVGIPIKCVKASIRDQDGTELPAGVEGEICLAGANIMQGYFNAPELTEATLRDGWLWTGDIGRFDDEGYLFITGRKKDIINSAGERISAREIEEVLEENGNVLEAAVVGMPDPIVGELILAFIVEKERAENAVALRTWCNDRLSHLKVPRQYVFTDTLPRTPSGKVKKHLLLKQLEAGNG